MGANFVDISDRFGNRMLVSAAVVGRIADPDDDGDWRVYNTGDDHIGWISRRGLEALVGVVVPATPGWFVAKLQVYDGREPQDEHIERAPVVAWRISGTVVEPVTPSWDVNGSVIVGDNDAVLATVGPDGRSLDDSGNWTGFGPGDEGLLEYFRSIVEMRRKTKANAEARRAAKAEAGA